MNLVTAKMNATARRATAVSSTLSESIEASTPQMVKEYTMSWASELDRVDEMLSTSLVMRLMSSPCWRRSKNARGSPCMAPNSTRRMSRTMRPPTPFMTNCWPKRASQSPA